MFTHKHRRYFKIVNIDLYLKVIYSMKNITKLIVNNYVINFSLDSHTKKNSGMGVRLCLLNVFGVAETESEVHFASSLHVFDITSKNLHSHTKKTILTWASDHVYYMFLGSLKPNPKSILPHHVRLLT